MEPPRRLPLTDTERHGVTTEDMVAGTGRGGTRTARPIRHEESGIIPGSSMGGNLPPMAFAHDYYDAVDGDLPTQYATTHLPLSFSEDVEVNGLRVRRGDAWTREDDAQLVVVQNPAAFYVGAAPWNVSIHYAYYVSAVVE